jgi:hypothetical protein
LVNITTVGFLLDVAIQRHGGSGESHQRRDHYRAYSKN